MFQIGSRVRVTGLVSAAEHNGKIGQVTAFASDSDRIQVQLEDGTTVKVKPSNLESVRAVDMESKSNDLKRGSRVKVVGLISTPQHNDKAGTIHDFDSSSGRIYVKLDDDTAILKIKPTNVVSIASGDLNVEPLIRQVFNESKFIVRCRTRPTGDIDVHISSRKDNSDCLELNFKLQKNSMNINSLTKCTADGGGALLKLVDRLVELLPPSINRIELVDLSQMEICDTPVDMPVYKILTKGISWYNSYGYISKDHETEMEHNQRIANSPFIAVLRQALPEPTFREIMQGISTLFAGNIKLTDETTVKRCLQTLMDSIDSKSEDCDSSNKAKSELLAKIVNILKPSVRYYHRLLTKQRAGKRRRHRQTKRNRKCKKTKRNNKRTNKR